MRRFPPPAPQDPSIPPGLDLAGEGGTILDRRLLLSGDAAKGAHASLHATLRARPLDTMRGLQLAGASSSRTAPAQEINKQYEIFMA